MTLAYDLTHRGSPAAPSTNGQALEDRFEVIKDIGDGSFGSVVLARVRSAGSSVARRGTVVSKFGNDEQLSRANLTPGRLPSRR
jgi:meiosis induction protein kinase IME2/SME1